MKALSKTSKSFKILEAMLGNDQEVVSNKDTDFIYSVTFKEDSRRRKLKNSNHGCVELKWKENDWLVTVIDG